MICIILNVGRFFISKNPGPRLHSEILKGWKEFLTDLGLTHYKTDKEASKAFEKLSDIVCLS